MGIQIYIKREALEERGIRMIDTEETDYYPCHCGKTKEGICPECGTTGKRWTEQYTDVEGLPLLMSRLGDTVYHDANHWGSSRKPILAFIEKHKLKAGEDWYEA